MIGEVRKDFEFEQFSEAYTYLDSETVIDETEMMSNRQQSAVSALTLLLDASIDYFTLASRIPSQFQEQMNELTDGQTEGFPILLQATNEREENLSERLNNSSVQELLTLLNTLRENIESEDETILKLINEL